MTTLYGPDGFESGLGSWTITGTNVTQDSGQAKTGTYSCLVDKSGGAGTAHISNTYAKTGIAIGFHFRIATYPGATQACVQSSSGTNLQIGLTTAGVIRAYAGATNTSGITLSLNTWYWISAKFDSTANPRVTTLRINGANEITASNAVASSNQTDIRFGSNSATTPKYYFDNVVVTDNLADYPIAEPASAKHDPMGLSGFFGI